MNLFAEEKQTHRLWKTYHYQRGHIEGRDGPRVWDWHVYTEVYGMIGQRDLLGSTRKSTQYSVIIYVGKESEGEWIYVYVWANLFVIQQKWSQPCKSTLLQQNFKKKMKCSNQWCLVHWQCCMTTVAMYLQNIFVTSKGSPIPISQGTFGQNFSSGIRFLYKIL